MNISALIRSNYRIFPILGTAKLYRVYCLTDTDHYNNRMKYIVFLAICLLSVIHASLSKVVDNERMAAQNSHTHERHGGLVVRSVSRLGENELRVRYGKFHSLEVTVPNRGEDGMFYRQVTDGHQFIQNIFQGRNNIIDCEINRNKNDIHKFVEKFRAVETMAPSIRSTNVRVSFIQAGAEFDEISTEMLDMRSMLHSCKVLLRQWRALSHDKISAMKMKKKDQFKAHPRNTLQAFRRLHGDKVALQDSKLLMKEMPKVPSQSGQQDQPSARTKRRVIYPGTNWCGSGNVAHNRTDFGNNVATDKCCYSHDFCPFTIEAYTTKYNYFNFRFHTISHCQCDEIFRWCLKSASNSVANLVGEIYFNTVGMKCFLLKKKEKDECTEWTWYGSCTKYGGFQAEVHEPFEY